MISKKERSFIKYCEEGGIISDTLALNQDVLQSGRDCSHFLCLLNVESTECSLLFFFFAMVRRGSISVRTNRGVHTFPKNPA